MGKWERATISQGWHQEEGCQKGTPKYGYRLDIKYKSIDTDTKFYHFVLDIQNCIECIPRRATPNGR